MSLNRPTGGRRKPSTKRLVVDEVMKDSDAFRSAQDIHHLLRSRGEAVGLATVYRNLQAMVDADEVDTLRNEDGELLYRKCSPKHHHHLVCRSCGRVVEVKGPAVERWASQAAEKHGFVDVAHTVEIFGLCPSCRG
ncbi:Fur family transcriptional regulator [Nocardioides caldifontis]|uniref:Fur family transcriptional regulator n=1 Tax=Nocardioides caldifontis TaxID=2588938 RepID=UPI0011DF0382|nr:transcriptional repressor [Nocardioides caldifontis]